MTISKILYRNMYWKAMLALLSFFTNLFLAHLLKASVSGELYSFIYYLSFFAAFFTLGLDISLNYYLSRRAISFSAARNISIGITIFALIISLPLLALIFRFFGHPDISLEKWLFFSACHISGTLLTSLSGAIFTAYGRSWQATRYAVVINIVLIAVLFFTARYAEGAGLVENIFMIYFSFSFLQGIFLFALASAAFTSGRDVSLVSRGAGVRSIFGYSARAFFINFIFFLSARLSIYLLPYFVSAGELGNYIQTYKLVEYFSLAASFLYYPFIAWVAGPDDEYRKAKMLLLLVRLSNMGILVFCAGMLVFGKMLLPFMYGRSFEDMYGIFLFFFPGIFPVFSSTFFTAYFYGAHRLKNNFISGCIQLAAAVMLFFPLTAAMGVRGAALAFSISSLSSMIYDCIVFRKIIPYRTTDVLLMHTDDWRRIRDFAAQLFKVGLK